MAANTNMHVTREQAVTMLGAVIAKKRLLKEAPVLGEPDSAFELVRLTCCEGMLQAALHRISDLEARRNREAQARRPIREKLTAVCQPADPTTSVRSPW